ncbi:hypothetical protein BDP27DRAFT_1437418 [Rhodocollybia butyracea]|uniref:Uncharacterized protein n=1 Tax=Rhodocollybia butyracea TaxID=206335 RepID=A0A9P5P5A1_9AGAR|nr:hypothetical protein BDP27DRAFT_1437418 [Rhodocollybia butyracea]
MSISILESGLYTITSLSGEGGRAGVPPTKPAFQPVVTFPQGEFHPQPWEVTRTPEGTYRLSTLGYAPGPPKTQPEEQSRINTEPLRTTKSLPPQATPPQLFQVRRVLMD